MAEKIHLLVNGKRYGGWKSVRVTSSIESIAGSFALEVSDRWDGRDDPWAIAEEDECRVEIDGTVVIDGWVDKRSLSSTKDSRSLSYSGRDRASALLDCSALVDAGSVSKGKWTFYNVNLFEIATKLAEPFGIPVSVQPGLTGLVRNKKVVLHPGDTGFEVISRLAAAAGVLVVSDGAGGIVITRTGTERAAPLVEGKNILAASVDYDASDRFYRYLLSSQVPGSDEAAGDSARVKAQAIDEGVRRKERVILIRPDKGYNLAESRQRADWEARHRAARAERVSVTVQGWEQPDGKLWAINKLTRVVAPRLIGVDRDLLISQVERTVADGGGTITRLSLVRPDAFTPEPTATVKGSGGLWKEIATGGL